MIQIDFLLQFVNTTIIAWPSKQLLWSIYKLLLIIHDYCKYNRNQNKNFTGFANSEDVLN